MRIIKYILIAFAAILASGCATVHRGVVAMKINDTQAHVCLNKGEAQVGDTVQLYRNVCTAPASSKPVLNKCEKRLMGNGTVTEILNEHYSVVSLARGTDFKEGDFVER